MATLADVRRLITDIKDEIAWAGEHHLFYDKAVIQAISDKADEALETLDRVMDVEI